MNAIKALALTAMLGLLAACTTTQIEGANSIGFENVRSVRGAQLYVCNTGSCGDLAVAVHKTERLTSSEAKEYDAIANSDVGRRLVTRAIQGEVTRNGNNGNVTVGTLRPTTIGSYKALRASVSHRGRDGKRFPGELLMIRTPNTVEIFFVASESAKRSANEVRRLATLWSRNT